ncbi:fused DSP-PTPase phosphatase/NAD kinase-like protein [Tundrisphaera lichenicola]|uniref:fused DSP-PTPase phosphatase/NAD kinase-like protein n=1 Tax=Tundrisphaera lichenicola TaxID=2029860 RepID=UPI003EB7922D
MSSNPSPPRPSRLRARLRRLSIAALMIASLTTFVFRNSLFRENFGVVDEGRVYRSAQPTAGLPALVASKGLATILNLRGGSDANPWYADEVAATRKLGIDFYDLPMIATVRPTRKQLLTVLDVLDRCNYPLLIHCKSGSDRTGLVSALYLMSRKGMPPERAEDAFSLYYGHVPILGTRHLHEPLHEYADWLKSRKLDHTPGRFRNWVAHEYRAADPLVELVPLPTGPRPPRASRLTGRPSGSVAR